MILTGGAPSNYLQAAAPTGIQSIDTATLAAVAAASQLGGKKILLAPGNYNFNGATPLSGFSNLAIEGDSKETTSVTVSDGGRFVDDATAWLSVTIRNITFTGNAPAGFFRNTYAGNNVHNPKIVENCIFQNHQVCALEANANDDPNWKITNNRFWTTNVTTAIDLALAGLADACVIAGNDFTGARVNIKLRAPDACRITDDDFEPYYAQSGGVIRARVWLVPSSAGGDGGLNITGGRFGNEQIGAGDWHILIAGELAGTYVGDMQPDLATAQTNPLTEITVTDTVFAGNATAAPPPIYTLTPYLPGLKIAPTFNGTRPAYAAVQFANAPTSYDQLHGTVLLGPVTMQDTDASPPPVWTNAPAMFGHPLDPSQIISAVDPVAPQDGPGDVGELKNLSPAGINGWTGGAGGTVNATLTAETDRRGGTDAAEISATAANGHAYGYLAAAPTIGRPGWLEFDLKQGLVTPAAAVTVVVQSSSSHQMLSRIISIPAAGYAGDGWCRYRFKLQFIESPASILVQFTIAVSGQTVIVGRVKTYHARSPVSIEPGFPIADTATTATAGAIVPTDFVGYIVATLNGARVKIPYYNV